MCYWSSGSSGGGICAVPIGFGYASVPRALASRRCRSCLFQGVIASPRKAQSDIVDSSGHGFQKGLRTWKPMCRISSDSSAWEAQGSDRFFANVFASALCVLLSLLPLSNAIAVQSKASKQFESSVPSDTFDNVPQTLSGADKARRIQRPKSAQAESCTRKCVSTCIRGGAGAPGEGPLNVRRPLVVFKEGFRSRQYCLLECSEICNLIPDGQDGP